MCGLTAYIDTRMTQADLERFQNMLFVSNLRGPHSTGVFRADYDDGRLYLNNKHHQAAEPSLEIKAVKTLGMASNLMVRKAYKDKITGDLTRDTKALVGHARYATKGSVSITNAHPFFTDHLVGVHNGTIRSGLKFPDHGTDSEALYNLIDEKGIEALKEVEGAYALIWVDVSTKKLHILRNYERTLFYTHIGNSIMVSSEERMIRFAMTEHQLKNNEITAFIPKHLYSVDLTAANTEMTSEDVASRISKEVRYTAAGRKFRDGRWYKYSSSTQRWEEDPEYEEYNYGRFYGRSRSDRDEERAVSAVPMVRLSSNSVYRPKRTGPGDRSPVSFDVREGAYCSFDYIRERNAKDVKEGKEAAEDSEDGPEKGNGDSDKVGNGPVGKFVESIQQQFEPRNLSGNGCNAALNFADLEDDEGGGEDERRLTDNFSVPYNEYLKIIAEGCANCTCPISPGFESLAYFGDGTNGLEKGQFICDDCVFEITKNPELVPPLSSALSDHYERFVKNSSNWE